MELLSAYQELHHFPFEICFLKKTSVCMVPASHHCISKQSESSLAVVWTFGHVGIGSGTWTMGAFEFSNWVIKLRCSSTVAVSHQQPGLRLWKVPQRSTNRLHLMTFTELPNRKWMPVLDHPVRRDNNSFSAENIQCNLCTAASSIHTYWLNLLGSVWIFRFSLLYNGLVIFGGSGTNGFFC